MKCEMGKQQTGGSTKEKTINSESSALQGMTQKKPIGSGPLLWYHVLFRTRLLTVEV